MRLWSLFSLRFKKLKRNNPTQYGWSMVYKRAFEKISQKLGIKMELLARRLRKRRRGKKKRRDNVDYSRVNRKGL